MSAPHPLWILMWVGVGLCFIVSIGAGFRAAKEQDPRKRRVLVVLGVSSFWTALIIGLRFLIAIPRPLWWALIFPSVAAGLWILRSKSKGQP